MARWSDRCGRRLVVFINETVGQGLELLDRGWLGSLGGEPILEGLVEAFDFPAGGGVVRSGVFLLDAEFDQAGLEGVAAASVAGEPGGVNHPVVSENRGRISLFRGGLVERCDDEVARHAFVGGDREGVAGVVIEPDQDLGVGPVGESVVSEIGLPGLVRKISLEPDEGRARSLLWFRSDQPGSNEPSADSGTRSWRRFTIAVFTTSDTLVGEACGRRDRGSNAVSPSLRYRPTRRVTHDRDTPNWAATSAWVRPSTVTAKMIERRFDIANPARHEGSVMDL